MALAIDTSSPALATAAPSNSPETATTASFTPPANSLLVVLVAGDSSSATTPTLTVTDNLGVHLTYTQRVWANRVDSPSTDGHAAIYTAPVTSSAAMTVSVTNSSNTTPGSADLACQVQVLTDGGSLPTVGAVAKTASTTSGTAVSTSYTATAAGSWGFGAVSDWNATGTMTAGTGCTMIGTPGTFTGLISYGFVRRTTADGVSAASTTLATTLAAASTAKHIAAVEILGAAAAAQIPTLVMART